MPEVPACPICTMTDVLEAAAMHECATCGHEWPKQLSPEEAEDELVVKDANGNRLSDGDAVTLTKDPKVKGSSKTLKAGTKVKGIRLIDPTQHADHDIDAKVSGMGVLLKAKFVKRA
jgi:protein PhnA